ncbi:response regulator transcription factor [Aquirufa aurantiipilula]|uniref:response regulator transcription factor n=1 Tax=Aquirufa aurantiipilula TaxID=2696561 RepID=UPI001CAA72DA|nr:helix-turn-helix transcriptional regulator [Aquirufa aurantiipilula]MBZ1327210.1 helix-turn-helix transcriptional regulator [Aquirufa aurantiipilula]
MSTIQLTLREFRVVQLAQQGCSNKGIAKQLNIQESTVKSHRKNIMKKLGLKGKTEFIRYLLNK